MKQFEINDKNEGQRLDKFLQRILKNAGTSFIYKMLRKKNITLNDKKADGNVILNAGDVVKIYFSDETYEKMSGNGLEGGNGKQNEPDLRNYNARYNITDDINLEHYIGIKPEKTFKASIIYEDDNIILINKPAGILSQKAGPDDISLNEYINYYIYNECNISDEALRQYKPSAVNRLDRNTSGIVIAAKSLKAAAIISKGLKERTINKYYKCVVAGSFDKEGLYTGYLFKDDKRNVVSISENNNNGSYIETEYELLENHGDYSVLSVHLLTGRSHQIRAHLAYLGFPIIGDNKYGNREINAKFKKDKQLLHAYKIVFPEYDDKILKGISGRTFICDVNW